MNPIETKIAQCLEQNFELLKLMLENASNEPSTHVEQQLLECLLGISSLMLTTYQELYLRSRRSEFPDRTIDRTFQSSG